MVASVALAFGLALGALGVWMMLEAGSFFSASAEQDNGLLGLGASSSQEASLETPAWIGLLLALGGMSAIAFGARGLYVTFEGRGSV